MKLWTCEVVNVWSCERVDVWTCEVLNVWTCEIPIDIESVFYSECEGKSRESVRVKYRRVKWVKWQRVVILSGIKDVFWYKGCLFSDNIKSDNIKSEVLVVQVNNSNIVRSVEACVEWKGIWMWSCGLCKVGIWM